MIDSAVATNEKLRIVARSLSMLLRAGATGFEPSLAIQPFSFSPIGADQFSPTSINVSGQIRLLPGSSQLSSSRSSLHIHGKTREGCEPMSEPIHAERNDPYTGVDMFMRRQLYRIYRENRRRVRQMPLTGVLHGYYRQAA